MPYMLDASIKLTPESEGVFQCDATDAYWNFTGAFGGWAVAVAVQAVSRSAGARGDLVSVNAIFPDALSHAPLSVRTTRLRERARTDFWRVEFYDHIAPANPLFSADLVMSFPRENTLTFTTPLADVPAPETLKTLPMPGGPKWLTNYDQRLVSGQPFTVAERPDSVSWLREIDGRPVDATGIAAISDSFMPRIFFCANKMHMCSTVSYSLSMFATSDELAAIGDDFLLLEADSDVVANGAYDQRGRIRSRDGKVLAVTNQIAFFKS